MFDTSLSYRKSSARKVFRIHHSPRHFAMSWKVDRIDRVIRTRLLHLVVDHEFDIEHALDTIYQQLDLFLSYKRRYKSFKFVAFVLFVLFPTRFCLVPWWFMGTMSSQTIVNLSSNKCLICTNDVWAALRLCHRHHFPLVWRALAILLTTPNRNFNNSWCTISSTYLSMD